MQRNWRYFTRFYYSVQLNFYEVNSNEFYIRINKLLGINSCFTKFLSGHLIVRLDLLDISTRKVLVFYTTLPLHSYNIFALFYFPAVILLQSLSSYQISTILAII